MNEGINIGAGKLYMNGECIGDTMGYDIKLDKKETFKPKHSKSVGSLTIGIELEGYDKAKQQLRNLEATMDRILEKQERIKPISNFSRCKTIKIIGDNGEVREVEVDTGPRHIGFDIDEFTKELASNMQAIVKAADLAAKKLAYCMNKYGR